MNMTDLSDHINGVKIIKDYTGLDFRMWPLASLTGWLYQLRFLMRKCMDIWPGQKRLAVITT